MKLGTVNFTQPAATRHIGWGVADAALTAGDAFDPAHQQPLHVASGFMGVFHIAGFLANLNDGNSSDKALASRANARLVGHALAAAGDIAGACGAGVAAVGISLAGNLVNVLASASSEA